MIELCMIGCLQWRRSRWTNCVFQRILFVIQLPVLREDIIAENIFYPLRYSRVEEALVCYLTVKIKLLFCLFPKSLFAKIIWGIKQKWLSSWMNFVETEVKVTSVGIWLVISLFFKYLSLNFCNCCMKRNFLVHPSFHLSSWWNVPKFKQLATVSLCWS